MKQIYIALATAGCGLGSPALAGVGGMPTLSTLVTFTGANGRIPDSGLVFDSLGNIYGTTALGGSSNDGTLFQYSATGLTTIETFTGGINGGEPEGNLLFDGSGTIYGTTADGGRTPGGTVFKLNTSSHALTTLSNFNNSDGYGPAGSLVLDTGGNLYGVTSGGGTTGSGTIFKVDAVSGTISDLYSFPNNSANPQGGLVADSHGNLFGTTVNAGTTGVGSTFEIAAGSNAFSTVYNFSTLTGTYPFSSLTVDSSGNLYGTTHQGGANNDGTVFEFSSMNHTFSTLATFNGSNGQNPVGGLIMDAAGDLFGTTTAGGLSGDGTVFEITAGSTALTTIVNFDGTDGSDPAASLLPDSSGDLYGSTASPHFSLLRVFFGAGGVAPRPNCW